MQLRKTMIRCSEQPFDLVLTTDDVSIDDIENIEKIDVLRSTIWNILLVLIFFSIVICRKMNVFLKSNLESYIMLNFIIQFY